MNHAHAKVDKEDSLWERRHQATGSGLRSVKIVARIDNGRGVYNNSGYEGRPLGCPPAKTNLCADDDARWTDNAFHRKYSVWRESTAAAEPKRGVTTGR